MDTNDHDTDHAYENSEITAEEAEAMISSDEYIEISSDLGEEHHFDETDDFYGAEYAHHLDTHQSTDEELDDRTQGTDEEYDLESAFDEEYEETSEETTSEYEGLEGDSVGDYDVSEREHSDSSRSHSWKDAASVLAKAFVPHNLLHRKNDAEQDSLDLKSMRTKVADFTQLTFSGVWNAVNPIKIFSNPLSSYSSVIFISGILTVFGLVMVQSASAVKGIATQGSAYSLFTQQVIFVVLGLILFAVALRMRIFFLRKTAFLGICVTTIALVAVLIPGIGVTVNHSRRWFNIFGLSLQPSELVKVALCVWGAHLLASRKQENPSYKELLFPLMPVTGLISLLIILEPNLSTMIIVLVIFVSLLWYVGLPLRLFPIFAVIGGVVLGVLALSAKYRAQRVMSFLGLMGTDKGANYQSLQAQYALASGGIFGVGLGRSKAKWNYLPNEHNDFIFAVVGEELGFIGAACVVIIFAILTFVGVRITLRSVDPFLRLLSGSITTLLSGQAVINIGYVVNILPVTGVQLPLISAGGTSAFTNLFLLGLLANCARHEPQAIKALQQSPKRGIFALPIPREYSPSSTLERRRYRQYAGAHAGMGATAPRNTRSSRAASERRRSSRATPRTSTEARISRRRSSSRTGNLARTSRRASPTARPEAVSSARYSRSSTGSDSLSPRYSTPTEIYRQARAQAYESLDELYSGRAHPWDSTDGSSLRSGQERPPSSRSIRSSRHKPR